ncbi:MAG: hypothetical protein J0I99_18370 [Devosia sp.]|uniref:hypothetical protein n=1 Tax=Devosia sp. TaxID=1871048 RepID=UPI001AC357CD|nr:hypothetical protein [Devosia sp.]MBN9317709.1 hypothetical protein [Devosia sp.]
MNAIAASDRSEIRAGPIDYAGPKPDGPIDQISDVWGKLTAIATVCRDLEAKLPIKVLNDVASVATTGIGSRGRRAKEQMIDAGYKEIRSLPPEGCNDKLRARFDKNLGYLERNVNQLGSAIRAERGY